MAIHGADDWILVTGASLDKKADEIVGALAPSFDTIICTAAHHKGADAESIAAAARHGQSHGGCSVAATIEEAVRLSPGDSRARKGEEFMWRVDCSWRSNTPPSRRVAAPRIWNFF